MKQDLGKQCSWQSGSVPQLQPSVCDAEHLDGTLLQRVGRSTALDFADANIESLVTDISEHLQVVAVPAHARQRLDVDRAAPCHADVFSFWQRLQNDSTRGRFVTGCAH